MTIFDAFRKLSQAPEVLDAIARLEEGHLPQGESRDLAKQVWAAVSPVAPAGLVIARYCDWGKMEENAVWKGLYGYKPEAHAARIEMHLKHSKGALSVLFVRPVRLPQPKTMIF